MNAPLNEAIASLQQEHTLVWTFLVMSKSQIQLLSKYVMMKEVRKHKRCKKEETVLFEGHMGAFIQGET